jgi:hypothetical protein
MKPTKVIEMKKEEKQHTTAKKVESTKKNLDPWGDEVL